MAKTETNEEKLIEKLEKYQEDNKNGKYKYVAKHEDDDGYYSKMHEYECPNGEVGYQIFIYKNGEVKSKGFGQEALIRTFDWMTTSN